MTKKARFTFWKHPLVRHLLVAVVATFLIVQGVLIWINYYTDHNESSPLPDFTGMSLPEVAYVTQQQKWNFQVVDSVFHSGAAPGSVVQQNPAPGNRVKENRTIFLTVNATVPEQVTVPDLRGATLRLATSRLQSLGLLQGNLEYVTDMAVNSVLRQRYNGLDIAPGTKVPKGAAIDLVVGKGLSRETTQVPSLIGLSPSQARDSLRLSLLEVGSLVGDETVMGSALQPGTRVYRQNPLPGSSMSLGGSVDLWITIDAAKLLP